MRALEPVLVANRGEIAVRILRTVHRLGLRSAAVFTDPDARAAHVDAADLAAPIDSYLSVESVLEAAARLGARSVHPGYGFLAENAAFARAVRAAGLTWIGPPPEAIELMGDKGEAKAAARAAGVPVVPSGEEGCFPVVVKAVAGGGGKGLRVVRAAGELEAATAAARREAQAAFGDDRVLVERYLERPRHIEIQVLADAHGAVVHLGERECSLQRRHQKVIEEAPSPAVSPALRERMGAAAVALARDCGYVGAGTVEFIVPTDGSEDFFFLEMNTRLQVEHPVTELVYDVDLVEHQLRSAAGQPLSLRQADLVPRGHAVEARLYAEDPAAGFLPATGTVRAYREPDGVRVDSGVRAGTAVGTSYDPLLAKLIAHGADRDQALGRLDRALADLDLLGVTTNAAFSRALLARDDVRRGDQDTGLLERVLDELAIPPPADLLAAGVHALFLADITGLSTPPGPWRRTLSGHGAVHATLTEIHAAGRSWSLGPHHPVPGGRRVTLDGVSRRYAVSVEDGTAWVARDGHHVELAPATVHRRHAGPAAGSLEAPMPGTVLLVEVANGDRVAAGDVLIVLESMKMELSITAPTDGVVAGLTLTAGDSVSHRQPLVAVLAPAPS